MEDFCTSVGPCLKSKLISSMNPFNYISLYREWMYECRLSKMGECRTLGNVGQKRALSFPRLCTQGILQYINLSSMFHIFTYQLLILYANKRTALTWFKVWICKTERTSKLKKPTSAVGVKSDNCWVMSDTDVLGTYWWNIGCMKSDFCGKKIKKICASKWLNLLIFSIYLLTSWRRV